MNSIQIRHRIEKILAFAIGLTVGMTLRIGIAWLSLVGFEDPVAENNPTPIHTELEVREIYNPQQTIDSTMLQDTVSPRGGLDE